MRALLFFLILSPLSHTTWAKTFTWLECVQLAKQNNLDLQIAESHLVASEEQKKASVNGFLPHLSATASKSQSSLNGAVSDSYGAQLNLSQNIFAGLSDLNKSRQARLNLEIAQFNLQITRAQVSAELKKNFENLVYAQMNAALIQSIQTRREDNLRNVELRFNGGRENKGSVLLSRAYFAQAQSEAMQSSQQILIAQETLARSLGLSEAIDLSVTGNVPSHVTLSSEPDYRALAEKVPEYQVVIKQEELARADVKAAEVNFYPSLDLTANYGKVDSVFFSAKRKMECGRYVDDSVI